MAEIVSHPSSKSGIYEKPRNYDFGHTHTHKKKNPAVLRQMSRIQWSCSHLCCFGGYSIFMVKVVIIQRKQFDVRRKYPDIEVSSP